MFRASKTVHEGHVEFVFHYRVARPTKEVFLMLATHRQAVKRIFAIEIFSQSFNAELVILRVSGLRSIFIDYFPNLWLSNYLIMTNLLELTSEPHHYHTISAINQKFEFFGSSMFP